MSRAEMERKIERQIRLAREAEQADWITYLIRDPRRQDLRGNQLGWPVYVGQTDEFGKRVRNHLRKSEKLARRGKQVVDNERNRLEETVEYGLLAQNNEASALSISTAETHAGLIVDATAAETEQRRARDSRHLFNSKLYVIKMVVGDTVIRAVRKTDRGWTTKRRRSLRSFVYEENRLAVDQRPHFEIETSVDFFIIGDDILILNKGHFESALRYRQAHQNDFQQLQGEAEFSAIFVDMQPLVDHIGLNKIQLRRAAAIRQKGHYRDPEFMDRLRERHAEYGLNIAFDGAGRIQVTPASCVDIITALLDHRLASGFSTLVYDVPSSVEVHS